jgi:sortase A
MRTLIRLIGVAMMVTGLVMVAVQVQTIWGTGGGAAAEQGVKTLEADWARTGPSDHGRADRGPAEYARPIRYQEGFAIMRIPRLGADWEAPVVKGVKDPALALGVGWFPHSVLPGEIGNFSVAGHRCCAATHGEPFAHLDTIKDGDKVFVETRTTTYVYEMHAPYITTPKDVSTVAPVPGEGMNATPTKAYITLVTCNPYWSSDERLITHGVLVRTIEK